MLFRSLFTRHAVTKAAASGREAFVGLWTVKAFALEVAGGKGFYDALSGNKWQDVVLIASGWPENASQKIQTREEALNELLSKVKPTA